MRSEHSGEHVWADGTGQTGHSGDRERMRYQMAAALWHKLSWWRAPTSEKLNQFARGVDPLAEVRAQTGLQIQEKALRFQARLEGPRLQLRVAGQPTSVRPATPSSRHHVCAVLGHGAEWPQPLLAFS
jgi:hypothetical protein